MSNAAITVVIILCGLLVFLFLVWFVFRLISRYSARKLMELENTVRTMVIDLKNNSIRYFNHNKVKNIRTVTIDQFCEQFTSKDIDRFKKWLNSFFNKKITPNEYLEIEVFMNRSRKKAFTLLKCNGVDEKKQILHVDSYLFLYLASRTKHGYKIDDITYEEAIKHLKYEPSSRGSTINFKFTYFSKNSTKAEISRLLFTQLKEVGLLYAYPPNRYLLEISDSEFTILDLRSNDVNSTINFVHNVVSGLTKLLEIQSVSTYTAISVGVVENKYFPHNPTKLIEVAKKMSNVAFEKNTLMVVYSGEENKDKYASEVEHIIKEHGLRYTFSPIYEVRRERVCGYLSFVEPINLSKRNIDEIYKHSLSSDENKKLLTEIIRETIKTFSSQNKDNNVVLFRDLKFQDCKTFASIVSRYKNIKIAPCFDEYDVSFYSSKNPDFFENISRLKEVRCHPCLKLTDKNLILDSKIYECFDYFIVYIDKNRMKKAQDTSQLGYRIVVEKLLRYNKPIILTRAESWSMVELLIRSGVEYIASNVIAGPDVSLPVIPSKNILKMKKMVE